MENIISLMEEFCDNYEYKFVKSYSGRGMYGRTCVGLVVPNAMIALVELCDYLRDNDIDNVSYCIGIPHTDNLGFDTILYFPEMRLLNE